jgi:RNA polymerase sigma factor (sigma-70 family)
MLVEYATVASVLIMAERKWMVPVPARSDTKIHLAPLGRGAALTSSAMSASRSDPELFTSWADGDRRAGAELLRRHFDALHRFFTNKVSATAEVEDLVQLTMMACVGARDRFRGDSSFRTFLFAIARHTLLKHLRDRKQTDALDADGESLADHGLGLSTVLGLRREQQLLLTGLRHISVDPQIVLELFYWEQLSATQLAAVLETSEAAIRGRLRKAKLELRAALDGLARDPQELASTLDGLDQWAASLRAQWS